MPKYAKVQSFEQQEKRTLWGGKADFPKAWVSVNIHLAFLDTWKMTNAVFTAPSLVDNKKHVLLSDRHCLFLKPSLKGW